MLEEFKQDVFQCLNCHQLEIFVILCARAQKSWNKDLFSFACLDVVYVY